MKKGIRKFLPFFLLLVILLSMTALSACKKNSLSYTLSDDKSYYIVSGIGTCTDRDVVIPAEYKNKPVREIGEYAFQGCAGIASVVIPDSVTTIGRRAFSGCCELKSIAIPDSVTSIGSWAFFGCSGLTSVTFGDNSGLETIENHAFYNCTDLTSVTFGANSRLTNIGEYAFNRSGLTSFTVPASVTQIGTDAFGDCRRLVEVCNRSALTVTAGAATNGQIARNAKHVYSEGESCLRTDDDGFVFYDDGTTFTLITYAGDRTSLVLPETADGRKYTIYPYAFWCNLDLTAVQLGGSVKSIEEHAFDYCRNLTDLTFGADSAVEKIGEAAFYDCVSLTNVDRLPAAVTQIGSYAFYHCSAVTSILFPPTLKNIGDGAFYGCSSLTSVDIPASITKIGKEAFAACNGLTKVTITDIAKWCAISFGDQYANPVYYARTLYLNDEPLTELEIPDTVASVKDYTFRNCTALTSVTIPSSVKSIGKEAFRGCTGLKTIVIPDPTASSGGGLGFSLPVDMTYGKDAFTDCLIETATMPCSAASVIPNAALKTVVLTSGTSIGAGAFSGAAALASVTFPDTLTSVGGSAFKGCVSLTGIALPASVTSIGSEAFRGCTALTSVSVEEGGTAYHSAGNCLIETATGLLIQGCNNSVIPTDGSVTAIGAYAFYGYKGLKTVVISDSVTSIGKDAFSDCLIENATIPCFAIAQFASGSLKTVVLTSGESIADGAFRNCFALTSVTIPASVTSIGKDAFAGCNALASATFEKTNGWSVATAANAEEWTDVTLGDAAQDAQYLKNTHRAKYWKNTDQ